MTGRHEPGEILQGGGELSARTLALAAGVVADAARRSAPDWEGAAGAGAQGDALARRAVALGAVNAKTYSGARAALAGGLPTAPAATRDYVLGDILERAAEAPLALASAAADTAALGAHVADHAPGPAAADAIAAAVIAAGVARAATHLVAINLATRSGDSRLLEAQREVRRATAALPDGV
jgi:hypothetical protein